MNFREFVEHKNKKAFREPRRFTVSVTSEPLPHEPGALSKNMNRSRASQNNTRAQESPNTGEVVGRDSSSGDALVRQPGNRVVRVQAPQAAVGNTVSINRSEQINQIRREGAVSSNSIVSSSGWEPVSGRPGVERSSFTVSQSVEGIELLGDPCTPPDVKIELVEAAIDIGVAVNAQGQYTGYTRSIRDGSPVQSDAAQETFNLLNELYEQAKQEGKQRQTLAQQISLDSLGGVPTENVGGSPTTAVLWRCDNGTCIQDANGFFATKEECEQLCGENSFNCVNGQCVSVRGPSGRFNTFEECVNSPCNTRWDCVNGSPVPSPDGRYSTEEGARADGCFWGYNFNGSECVPALGGTYPSLQCCLTFLDNPPQDSFIYAGTTSGGPETGKVERVFSIFEAGSLAHQTTNIPADFMTVQGLVQLNSPIRILNDTKPIEVQGQATTDRTIIQWFIPKVERGITVTFTPTFTFNLGLSAPPTTRAEVETALGNSRYLENVISVRREVGIPRRVTSNSGVNTPRTWLQELSLTYGSNTFQGVVNTYGIGTVLFDDVLQFPYSGQSAALFNHLYGLPRDNVNGVANVVGVTPEFSSADNIDFDNWSVQTDQGRSYLTVTWPATSFTETPYQAPNYLNALTRNANYITAFGSGSKPGNCFSGEMWQTNSGEYLVDQDQWGVDYTPYEIVFDADLGIAIADVTINYSPGTPLSSPFVWERRNISVPANGISNVPVVGNLASWQQFAQQLNSDQAIPQQSTAFPLPENCQDA